MIKVVQAIRRANLGKSGDFPQSRSRSLRKKDIATEMRAFQWLYLFFLTSPGYKRKLKSAYAEQPCSWISRPSSSSPLVTRRPTVLSMMVNTMIAITRT